MNAQPDMGIRLSVNDYIELRIAALLHDALSGAVGRMLQTEGKNRTSQLL